MESMALAGGVQWVTSMWYKSCILEFPKWDFLLLLCGWTFGKVRTLVTFFDPLKYTLFCFYFTPIAWELMNARFVSHRCYSLHTGRESQTPALPICKNATKSGKILRKCCVVEPLVKWEQSTWTSSGLWRPPQTSRRPWKPLQTSRRTTRMSRRPWWTQSLFPLHAVSDYKKQWSSTTSGVS